METSKAVKPIQDQVPMSTKSIETNDVAIFMNIILEISMIPYNT